MGGKIKFATVGDKQCENRHREGWFCTRLWQHAGDHIADTGDGVALKRWRGGRTNWSTSRTETKGTP